MKRMARVGALTGTFKNCTLWHWSPTVGPTSLVRLHIFVPSHVELKYHFLRRKAINTLSYGTRE